VRDAAFVCDWVGTAIPFQRCLIFIIATANKEFQLTAGKFVPVSNVTMMNVCIYLYVRACVLARARVCVSIYVFMRACMYVCMYVCAYAYMYICMYVCMYLFIYPAIHENINVLP
jgi:hypothetical protein